MSSTSNTNTNYIDSGSSAVSNTSATEQTSSNTHHPSSGAILALLVGIQEMLGETTVDIVNSNYVKQKDSVTGMTTYTTVGKYQEAGMIDHIKATQAEVDRQNAEQEKQKHRLGIFQKFMKAFTAVIMVAMVVGSGGTAAALVPTLFMLLNTIPVTKDGATLLQLGEKGLADKIGGDNAQLFASLIIGIAAMALSGGFSLASSALASGSATAAEVAEGAAEGAAEGVAESSFSSIAKTAAATSAEYGSQTFLATGLPEGLAGLTGNERAKLAIEILGTAFLMGAGIAAFARSAQGAATGQTKSIANILIKKLQSYSTRFARWTEGRLNPVMVDKFINRMQALGQGFNGVTNIGAGAVTWTLGDFTGAIDALQKEFPKFDCETSMLDSSDQSLQDALTEIMSSLEDDSTNLSKNYGQGLNTVAELVGQASA